MQNQNNSNIMISRQSGTRSGTPNSMVVLEQGRESPTRPPSGRRSVNRQSPLKRGGSSLEILPAEEDDSSRSSSRLSNKGVIVESPRQTQSAGSISRLSFTEAEQGNGDGKEGGAGLKRSSSIDGRAEVVTPDSPRKQVYLMTVKRNFEQHGMPKNEELAKAVLNHPSLQNGAISNSPSATHESRDPSHRKQHGERPNQPITDAENNDLKHPGHIEKGLERLSVEEAAGQGSDDKGHDDEINNTDSYYISHGSSSKNSKAASASVSCSAETNSYYLTHDRASTSKTSEIGQTSADKTEEPTTQTDQAPEGTSTSKDTEEQDDEEESDDEEDDEDEEDEEKAPFQLLGEFLEAVMEEDYENAEKLCKMVLLYEPDNAEAKQFQPLIEEMLKREREAQLWGSGSEGDEDDEDDTDDDDDDDDDEDSDEDEDDEEDSSSEEDDNTNEEKSDTNVEK